MNSAEILVLTGTDSAKPYVAVVDVNLCMLWGAEWEAVRRRIRKLP